MPISNDFYDIIEVFTYSALPNLSNPTNAADTMSPDSQVIPNPSLPIPPITPILPFTPITPVTSTTSSIAITPTTVPLPIPPELLLPCQAVVLNNFSDFNLPIDIQQISQPFFASFPPTPQSTVSTT